MEASTSLSVIADGKWHLYEWNLADDAVWSNFTGGNGAIGGPNSFIDSIFFYGDGGTANRTFEVFMDTVAYNPTGRLTSLIVPEVFAAGDFNKDGAVNAADLERWRGGFGVDGRGDADGDGDTDGADFLRWQRKFGASPATSATTNVPEPATKWLLTAGAAAAGCQRRGASRCGGVFSWRPRAGRRLLARLR